jgi:Spy/CpxP family protein refolding chaperone
MTKRSIVLIGLVAISVTALGVYAQSSTPAPPPPCMEHHRGPKMGTMGMMGGGPGRLIHLLMRSTDMTPDQETQAHAILDANHSTVEGIFTRLRQANADLANLLLGAQDVQADALSTELTRINQLQLQLDQQTANTILAIRALLKPEQLAKAAAAESAIEAEKAAHPHFMRPGE